jgi:hypothetical protein
MPIGFGPARPDDYNGFQTDFDQYGNAVSDTPEPTPAAKAQMGAAGAFQKDPSLVNSDKFKSAFASQLGNLQSGLQAQNKKDAKAKKLMGASVALKNNPDLVNTDMFKNAFESRAISATEKYLKKQKQDNIMGASAAMSNNPELVNSPAFKGALAKRLKQQTAFAASAAFKDNPELLEGEAFANSFQEKGEKIFGPSFLTDTYVSKGITDPGSFTDQDISDFTNTTYDLFMDDRPAFDAWADRNPVWAGRFFAEVASAGQQADGFDWSMSAMQTGLPFNINLEDILGGFDGVSMDNVNPFEEGGSTEEYIDLAKKYNPQGTPRYYGSKDYDDVNTSGSTGDFFKIGVPGSTGSNGLISTIQNDPFGTGMKALTMAVGGMIMAPMAPALAAAGAPAFVAAGAPIVGDAILSTIVNGGKMDPESLIKSAVTSYISTNLGDWLPKGAPGELTLANVYNSPDLLGSITRNVTNASLISLVNDGKLDAEAIFKTAGINTAMDIAEDIFKDSVQTNSAQDMVNSGTQLNGGKMSPTDALRLEDTSDILGVLGEGGLLDKLGIKTGYLKTDWIGSAADFIGGFRDRQTIITNNSLSVASATDKLLLVMMGKSTHGLTVVPLGMAQSMSTTV